MVPFPAALEGVPGSESAATRHAEEGKAEHGVADPRATYSYPNPALVLLCLFLLS